MRRSYKQITFWENNERIKYLKNFNSHVVNYFKNIGHSSAGGSWEEEPAKIERKEINKLIGKAHLYIIATGVSIQVINSKTGKELDLVLNIFNLGKMHIGYSPLLDSIERAIARYENDNKSAILRTCNPLFWITLFIDWVVSLPFETLGKVGFNQNEIEASFMGKLFKYVFYVISYLSLVVLAHIFISALIEAGYLTNH